MIVGEELENPFEVVHLAMKSMAFSSLNIIKYCEMCLKEKNKKGSKNLVQANQNVPICDKLFLVSFIWMKRTCASME